MAAGEVIFLWGDNHSWAAHKLKDGPIPMHTLAALIRLCRLFLKKKENMKFGEGSVKGGM